MKVCIPCTAAPGEQARLSIPSGQAPFFALWDAATDQLEFQSNPLAGQEHACACATTHWLQRLKAGVLITADSGRRAAQRLTEAGIDVLQTPMGNLGELLAWYRQGSLVPAPAGEPRWLPGEFQQAGHGSQPDAAYHHHGGQGQCGHGGQGQCGGAHQGRHGQGYHRRGGHGGGYCHSA